MKLHKINEFQKNCDISLPDSCLPQAGSSGLRDLEQFGIIWILKFLESVSLNKIIFVSQVTIFLILKINQMLGNVGDES